MLEFFDYFKALHLIFMVCWFAGLFYMVRLFIYHQESDLNHKENASLFKKQYVLMQKRLWLIIAWPAMLLTLLFGVLMLVADTGYLQLPFMHVKLLLVVLLVVYHLISHRIYNKQKNDKQSWSSLQLRIWNEVATLFLVSIVFIIVLKNEMDGLFGTVGFIVLGFVLFLAIRWYKKFRKH